MSQGIRESLQDCIDCSLSVRSDLGVYLYDVYLVERTWSDGELRAGTPTEVTTKVKPVPYIVDLSHNFRLVQNGNYQQGDLMIRQISKNQFATEEEIGPITSAPNKERFFLINNKRYTLVTIRERMLWWDIQVRKMAKGR